MVQYAPAPLARERKPQPTLEEIQTSRKIAEAMMREGSSYEPVGHWTQGAARVLQALSGSMGNAQANRQQKGLEGDANEALMGLYQPPSVTGGMPPIPSSAMQSEPPMSQEEASVGRFANPNVAPSPVAQAMAGGNAPASVRFNNPGAQYPGQSAQRFGTTGTETIGGGHKIAKFDSPVQGAAAQFDLLSRKYAGMPLAAAITKWSGGNSSPQYVAAISKATGLSSDTVLTPQMLSDPRVAVPLAKTMAQWEAGRPYPMDDNQWSEAHRMALGGPQQAAQPQPQQMPMQMADASQGQGMTRETLERMLANPLTRDAAQKLILRQAGAGEADYGKNGTIVQDRQGNFYSVQFGANGQKKIEPLQLGDNNLAPSRGVSEVDTGTGTAIIDKATGQDVRTIGKDLAGAEIQKQVGEATGKKIAAAPSDIAVAEDALSILDSIENDPYLDIGTGASSAGNVIWGTGGFDFQTKVDQATSGAFLSAIQQMRGMGALSNTEGQTATSAITRMKTAQSREGFLSALSDYRKTVRRGKEKAAAMLKQGQADNDQSDGWQTLPGGVRIREKR